MGALFGSHFATRSQGTNTVIINLQNVLQRLDTPVKMALNLSNKNTSRALLYYRSFSTSLNLASSPDAKNDGLQHGYHQRNWLAAANEDDSKGNAVSPISPLYSLHLLIYSIRYDGADNKVHLNEIPIPTPGSGKILVKIACASLCHSDVMLFEPNDQGLLLGNKPVTMGHEASGTVVELGEGVADFKVGDPVGFLPAADCCFECEPCRKTYVDTSFDFLSDIDLIKL